MANRIAEAFRRYGGDETKMLNGVWAQMDSEYALSQANPRTGPWHLRLTDTTDDPEARIAFGAALTEVIIGFAIYMSNLPVHEVVPNQSTSSSRSGYVLQLRDTANGTQLTLSFGTDGSLAVYRGGHDFGPDFIATLLDRSDPAMVAGGYMHIELKAIAHNTTGAIEIRVNEATVLNLTGVDTVATANVEFSQVSLMRRHAGLPVMGGGIIDIADFYVNDATGSECNDFIGDVVCYDRMPIGDTAQADFTPSTGATQYGVIDEVGPNDADGLAIDAPGITEVTLEPLPSNTSAVIAHRPWVRAKKDDAGTCLVAPNIRSNGEYGAVTALPLTTGYAYWDTVVHNDPDTDAPATPAAADAFLLVLERTA